MKTKVCVIGSGAGAGPIIYEMSKAGHDVIVLEKGPWIKTEQFTKDEMVATRRNVYTPDLRDERHVLIDKKNGEWQTKDTYTSGRDFWQGSAVGGSSNFMSGYFHRMKPKDFKLLSEYGPIEGANVVDWPISYDDMEPYYAKTEALVGVSGEVKEHKFQEPRSTPDYPYPPLRNNIISEKLEQAANKLDLIMAPAARAIISKKKDDRSACYYSGYCGSYGCSSDAKGSSRAALLNDAVKTGHCTILPNSKVYHLETNSNKKLVKAWYYDVEGHKQSIEADIFVVACQAIETSRLLLMSKNVDFPNGLSNNSGLVGKNLIFSAGGVGSGKLYFDDFSEDEAMKLKIPGLFINRAIMEWYEINDPEFHTTPLKGGLVDFVFEHSNPVTKAMKLKKSNDGLVYGNNLKQAIKRHFTEQRTLKYEIFVDWLPTDDCYVDVAKNVKDKWNDPVAKVKLGFHEHDIKIGKYIAAKSAKVLEEVGAKNVKWGVGGSPPANLQAGGCRFGDDPRTSVLDKNCKSHEVDNLYVTDGSFMPTGGSTTFTFTIYANSFRVADHLLNRLS